MSYPSGFQQFIHHRSCWQNCPCFSTFASSPPSTCPSLSTSFSSADGSFMPAQTMSSPAASFSSDTSSPAVSLTESYFRDDEIGSPAMSFSEDYAMAAAESLQTTAFFTRYAAPALIHTQPVPVVGFVPRAQTNSWVSEIPHAISPETYEMSQPTHIETIKFVEASRSPQAEIVSRSPAHANPNIPFMLPSQPDDVSHSFSFQHPRTSHSPLSMASSSTVSTPAEDGNDREILFSHSFEHDTAISRNLTPSCSSTFSSSHSELTTPASSPAPVSIPSKITTQKTVVKRGQPKPPRRSAACANLRPLRALPTPTTSEGPAPPPLTYAQIIYQALLSAPNYRLGIQEIYDFFKLRTPGKYHGTGPGWMSSVRHNLSMNDDFIRTERQAHETRFKGKGCIWTLSEEALREGTVRATTGFRKNRMGYENVRVAKVKKLKAAKVGKGKPESSGVGKPGWKKDPGPVPLGGLPPLPDGFNRTPTNRPVRMARLEREYAQGGVF